MVAPSSCVSGCPVGWLDTESDCWMVDGIMLDTEISPIIPVRSAAVPAFLATKPEVFSLAGGGGGVVAAVAPLVVVGTVTARVSVLPVVGSELPTDSDAAVVVTEYVDDVRGDPLDAVDEGVGWSCVRADSAEAWPVLHDEHSVMSFLVRQVVVLTSQFFYHMTLVMMIVSHRWRVVMCLYFVLWT